MTLRWLHISDFHFRGGDPYDRDVVLRALVCAVRTYREQGRQPDLIFATGDIAQSGKATEYDPASAFFDAILAAAAATGHSIFTTVFPRRASIRISGRLGSVGVIATGKNSGNGTSYGFQIYTCMLVKANIFRSHQCIYQTFWQIGIGYIRSILTVIFTNYFSVNRNYFSG